MLLWMLLVNILGIMFARIVGILFVVMAYHVYMGYTRSLKNKILIHQNIIYKKCIFKKRNLKYRERKNYGNISKCAKGLVRH